jgi:hypothetical protein
MKKLALILSAAVLFGLSFTEVSAKSTPEKEMQKCCKKLKREVRKALNGPSFENLKPDNYEAVTLICIINMENELEIFKIKGADQELVDYVKNTIDKKEIETNPKLAGKMVKFDLEFHHKPA